MNQSLLHIATISVVFLVCRVAADHQFITFYTLPNCEGNISSTYYDRGSHNVTDLIRSIRVLGLWSVISCDSKPCNTTRLHSVLTGGECKPGFTQKSSRKISFAPYGDKDMADGRGIKLRSENNLGGNSLTVSNGSTPFVSFVVKSYVFVGPKYSWLTYSGENYTGIETCIPPDSTVLSQGWGHTYVPMNTLNITSVRRVDSCDSYSSVGSKMLFVNTLPLSVILIIVRAKIN